ncbi:rod shape-determining protein MreC [Thermovenabulum sp.]|uniref:rod shape-determining protein MreC n=1 Tax=Thermovenabulum sp. TaxID=3100335 RepID=UPI003C7E504C
MIFLLGLFKKRQFWYVVLVIFLITLTYRLTYTNEQLFNRIERPILAVFSPISDFFSSVVNYFAGKVTSIKDIFYLKSQNEILKKKVDELSSYQKIYYELKTENEKLRRMLDLKERSYDYNLEAAEVIGRDPSNWFNILIIDKGTNSGVSKNMAVISEDGLVGYTVDVGNNWAKVLLIIDNRSSISAMIQRTRDNGVIKGSVAPAPPGYLKMVYLPMDASVVNGDVVISSGLGGIVPKGIIIGKVEEVKKESDNLMKFAIVKPAVDFNKLEYVFVIKNFSYTGRE